MSEVEYYDPPKNQMQQLLEELIDRGVIREWYYNGEYHWSYTKTKETVSALKDEPQPEVELTTTERKICETCKHFNVPFKQEPCKSCAEESNWESASEVKIESCRNCLHLEIGRDGTMYCRQKGCVKDKSKEKHWRPFKSCEELIRYYYGLVKKVTGFDTVGTVYDMPNIWVRNKKTGLKELLIDYDNDREEGVEINGYRLEYLFQYFTFLDGSPCGCEEE